MRLSSKTIQEIACRVTLDIYKKELKSVHAEVSKELQRLADDYVRHKFPNYEKVLEVAKDYVHTRDHVCFKYQYSTPVGVPEQWVADSNYLWDILVRAPLSLNPLFKIVKTSFEFPKPANSYDVELTVSAVSVMVKAMKPYYDLLAAVRDFKVNVTKALTLNNSDVKVKKNLPSLVKYLSSSSVNGSDVAASVEEVYRKRKK